MINPDGVSVKGCDIIYAPAGQAGEYAPLATNPYRGCGHACAYCYVPNVTKQPRPEFDAGAEPRKDFLWRLRRDAESDRVKKGPAKMKLLFAALAAAIVLPISTQAEEVHVSKGISDMPTIAQCLSMLQALRNLDGHAVIVKQNGIDVSIIQPWGFRSGSLRMRISSDIASLAGLETSVEHTRQSIIKEVAKSMPAKADGTPADLGSILADQGKANDLQRQYSDALGQPCEFHLIHIKASELKLDENEIPGTALSALAPILDDDLGPKP